MCKNLILIHKKPTKKPRREEKEEGEEEGEEKGRRKGGLEEEETVGVCDMLPPYRF